MNLFRLTLLSAAMSLAPALADDIGDSGYVEDEAGNENGDDGGSDTADDEKDGRCTAAAVNPTTALSVGLGVALLFGLRRRD
jgi:hypothetical protein